MTGLHVLVTGATGFVGRHLVTELLARGCRVRAIARDVQRARSMPWFDQVQFVAGDLHQADAEQVGRWVEGIDALAHLAWPGLPNYQALFHLEQNLMADYRFIKDAVEAGVRQVLVTGTCFEYGMQNGPLDEQCPARPGNPYGLAKHSLHQFLQALQLHTPFVLQWARLFYLHGQGQNPNSLLAALDRAIDSGATAFDMSAGEQLRDFQPVTEAARQLAGLLHCRAFSGVVNCASGQPRAVRSLVEQRLRERGAKVALNLGHYPYPSHEPMAFWAVTERLTQLLAAQGEPDGL
ncbi:NAD-dependent epimerase/dehydratase family protein [Pseudomonas vlassakiae]|jgi:dTDP-6-deoxy-L-talose 4-dehydrogenase (NAD+)|uniref:NAD-dependent epimerase/dehydratase family protein n=1 Tax=Pseudomonas TaxID=286 RepID=UPI000C1A27BD|nr:MULTISPECIES: NAD(P)-dependent oxidoreductase [unclassified Pseudomonas]AXQ47368.1 NAD(P)-dependent oxidoreductase [Stenotrophomonas rhizophila]MBS3183998.1 NAD(P)-dependent oxidoreductase [Pseudomonas sp. PCH44]PIK79412.1 epimerase [Pseudomonas sp. 382]